VTAFLFVCAFLGGALTSAADTKVKTRAQLPMPENSVPGSPTTVPAFATIEALDEYYDAADSGNCDDQCLAAKWMSLALHAKVALLDDGMTVWILRKQNDISSPSYHVCRVLYYPPGNPKGVMAWVLCASLAGQPPM
jgi:hypothetical protein